MSIISPPASTNSIGAAAHPQWSIGRLLGRAIVILIGIAVGGFIGTVVGVLTGWIEIQIC